MSLMRLLSVSRTLMPGKEAVGRYRVVQKAAVPRYGLGEIHGTVGNDPPGKGREEPDSPRGSEASYREGHGGDGDLFPWGVLARHSSALRVDAPQTGGARAEGRPGMWCSLLGMVRRCFGARGAAVEKPREASSQACRAPMQTTLALDSVRVVRNDLRDSDFEVVFRKGRGATSGREARAKAPDAGGGVSGRVWLSVDG